MDHATIAEIAVLIEQKLEDMSQKDRLGESSQDTFELDQQAVGRLSRMDALQSQAMVQAQQRRRDAQRTALNFALKRISEGEYGYCEECREAIEPERLRANPILMRCLSCLHS